MTTSFNGLIMMFCMVIKKDGANVNCVSTVVCGNITLTVVFYKQAQENDACSDPDMILVSGLQLDLVDGWA